MGETEYLLITIVFNLFFLLFMVAIFLYIWQYRRKKKENEVKLQYEKDLHQKELLSTQLEMQKKTMQEIGREIHDNIGQKLTLASLYFQQLIYENKVASDNQNVASINSILNDSLADLRLLSKSLSDDTIDNHTLPELLKIECDKINTIKKCSFTIDNQKQYDNQSYAVKSVLVRVTQEFIQNAIKHAECTLLKMDLSSQNNYVTLTLVDDGKGFDIHSVTSNGIGLKNIKKRAEIIGGQCTVKSDAIGTIIKITVPLEV
jgi:signal transduction histidine kinase